MPYRLTYSATALRHLASIQRYFDGESDPGVLHPFVLRIYQKCELIRTAPYQGTRRDDLGPGYRTTGMERRVTILFRVRGQVVRIVSIAYAGREYESDIAAP